MKLYQIIIATISVVSAFIILAVYVNVGVDSKKVKTERK